MIAVLYIPTPARSASGPITQQVTGSEAVVAYTAQQTGCRYVEVQEERPDWDVHYEVVDGAVVEKAA